MHDTDHLTNRILSRETIYVQYKKTSKAPNIHRPHSHCGCEMYYFQSGKATYIIGESIYNLIPGDMLLFRGELLHLVRPSANMNYVRSILNFDLNHLEMTQYIEQRLADAIDSPGGVIVHWEQEERSVVEDILSSLAEEERRLRIGRNEMIRAKLSMLLLMFLRKLVGVDEDSGNVQTISQREANIGRVLKVIKKRYRNRFSLDQLAEEIHLSKHYLCHCFKQVTGLTVNQYILSLRMDEGRRLLLETNKPVGVISEEVGIGGLTQFSRLFRQHEGVSPHVFRKLKRQQCHGNIKTEIGI